MRGHRMRFEGLLVLPDLDNREMVLPTTLLQDLKAHTAAIVTACLCQLLVAMTMASSLPAGMASAWVTTYVASCGVRGPHGHQSRDLYADAHRRG